ncbi:Ff.00g114120.m01.CDS01 [Fusarium sp. VM40]|nr:Ff.00g114120.m01.CDS01 [Fusarium sp. VM40]
MATSQFHGFFSLPLEIRQEIYKLATPPRVVHVKHFTEEDYETFNENLRLTPNYLHLDEALAHFSFNWRNRIPSHSNQQTLEAFGFSSNRLPYRPWTGTSTPRICLHLLAQDPQTAWQLVRKGYLYSQAPIPALLHTCSESRDELIKRGYRLAFSTRSSGPRTWFNYDHDILLLSREDLGQTDHRILSGCHWDLSQFDPEDMRRVRRVALERSTGSLFLAHPRFRETHFKFHDLTSVLRLFGHISELFLVEWTNEHMMEMCVLEDKKSLQKRHSYDSRGSWSYQDVTEVDSLLQTFPRDGSSPCCVGSIGADGELLYDSTDLEESSYFKLVTTSLREQLLDRRRKLTAREANEDAWWEIPIIKTVHVMTDWGHETLYRERSRVLQMVANCRQIWLIQGDTQRNNVHFSLQEAGFNYEEDESLYEEILCAEPDESSLGARRRWWIEKGIVPFLDASGR